MVTSQWCESHFLVGWLRGTFFNALKRAQEEELSKKQPDFSFSTEKEKATLSQFSYAQGNKQVPSIFSDPPRLLAEALLAIRSLEELPRLASSYPLGHLISPIDKPARTTSLDPSALLSTNQIQPSGSQQPNMQLDKFDVLHRLWTTNGDGMIPALMEGRAMELKEDLGPEMLSEIIARIEKAHLKENRVEHEDNDSKRISTISGTGTGRRATDERVSGGSFISASSTPHGLSSPLNFPPLNSRQIELLTHIAEHLRNGSSGVCCLAVKCSFGSFTEAVLAGTEEGEVSFFASIVPSSWWKKVFLIEWS